MCPVSDYFNHCFPIFWFLEYIPLQVRFLASIFMIALLLSKASETRNSYEQLNNPCDNFRKKVTKMQEMDENKLK